MAWSAPLTWVANQVLTAAQLNAQLRDNFNELDVAKITGAGQYIVSTGANALTVRYYDSDRVDTEQSTSSTSYVNLSTTGPTVTLTTGTTAGIFFGCRMRCPGVADATMKMSYAVSGATTSSADDARANLIDGVAADSYNHVYQADFRTDLTAGSNTFTAKYATGGSSCSFAYRWLAVMAL